MHDPFGALLAASADDLGDLDGETTPDLRLKRLLADAQRLAPLGVLRYGLLAAKGFDREEGRDLTAAALDNDGLSSPGNVLEQFAEVDAGVGGGDAGLGGLGVAAVG